MELQNKNTPPSAPKPQVQQPLKKCAPLAKHHFPVSALEITDNDRFLTIKEVIDMTGRSRSSIYSDMGIEAFPRAIKIGPRSVRWQKSAVLKWMQAQVDNSFQAEGE